MVRLEKVRDCAVRCLPGLTGGKELAMESRGGRKFQQREQRYRGLLSTACLQTGKARVAGTQQAKRMNGPA